MNFVPISQLPQCRPDEIPKSDVFQNESSSNSLIIDQANISQFGLVPDLSMKSKLQDFQRWQSEDVNKRWQSEDVPPNSKRLNINSQSPFLLRSKSQVAGFQTPKFKTFNRKGKSFQNQKFQTVTAKLKMFIIDKKTARQWCLCLRKKNKVNIKGQGRKRQDEADQNKQSNPTLKNLSPQPVKAMVLQEILSGMSKEKRLAKAVRHIQDAYYFRGVNNDLDLLDSQPIKLIWTFVNSSAWNTLLWFITILYQLLTFYEPRKQDNYQMEGQSFFFISEVIAISFYCIDYVLILIYTCYLEEGGKRKLKSMFKQKNAYKFFFPLLFILDLSIFRMNLIQPSIRFSRIFRALILCVYSKDLRRNLLGIMRSLKQLVILFLFYFFIIGVWAFIGCNIFPSDHINVDNERQDYGDFIKLFNMLYMLSTMDFYPDIALPSYKESPYYMIYFIPYIILFIFIFIPIPLALVYEGFRSFRTEILINDRIKQKTALLTCFICLDIEKNGYSTRYFNFIQIGFLSENQFIELMTAVYGNRIHPNNLFELYDMIDQNRSGKLSIEEFFTIIDVCENTKEFQLDKIHPMQCWENLLDIINSKVNLADKLEGTTMTLLTLVVTLINCILIIIAFFTTDENTLAIFDILDKLFLGFYILEAILKILAYGIEDYFEDDWNKFDFILISFQIVFDFILFNLISQTLLSSFKANRVLRLTKIQKIFRLFRAFRTIKIISFLVAGFQIFHDVKNLFYKIIICFPAVMRLVSIVWIVFFAYATIAVELLQVPDDISSPYLDNTCFEETNTSIVYILFMQIYQIYSFGGCQYASFNSFSETFLLLLQVFMSAGWSTIVFDYAYRDKDLTTISIFMGSFVFLSIFLLALTGGLIWEVFIIVDKSVENQDEIREIIEQDQDDDESHSILSGMEYKDHSLPSENVDIPLQVNQQVIKMRKAMRLGSSIQKTLQDINKKKIKTMESDNLTNHQKILLLLSDDVPDLMTYVVTKFHIKDNPVFMYYKELDQQSSQQNQSTLQQSEPKIDQNILLPKSKFFKLKLSPDFIEEMDGPLSKEVLDGSQKIIVQIIQKDLNRPITHQNHYQNIFQMYKTKFYSLKNYHKSLNVNQQEFVNTFVDQIKDDLRSLEGTLDKGSEFRSYKNIIANAILQSANQEMIKKKEFNHFQKLFGQDFERLREIKVTQLLQVQSRILFDLNSILKFSELNAKAFIQVLLCLEQRITQNLLKPGSFMKCIHQLENGCWFSIGFDHDSFTLETLGDGPWNYIKALLKEQEQPNKQDQSLQEFVKNNLIIASDIAFPVFTDQEKNENLSFRQTLIHISKQFTPLKQKTFENDEFKVCLLNIENQQSEERKEEQKSLAQKDYITPVKKFVGKILKVNAQSLEATGNKYMIIERTVVLVLVKHTFHDSLDQGKQKNDQQESNLNYLPFDYVIDFVQDFGLSLQSYSTNYFNKLQEIVFTRRKP